MPKDEPNEGASHGDAEPLACMNDGVEVDPSDARCMHPSSMCRFRETCMVIEFVRTRDRRKRDRRARASHAE